jgi:hypothetical protein
LPKLYCQQGARQPGDIISESAGDFVGICRLGSAQSDYFNWNSPDACPDSCARTIRATTYATISARFTSCTHDRPLRWIARGRRDVLLTVRDDRWPPRDAGSCNCASADAHLHRPAPSEEVWRQLFDQLRQADPRARRVMSRIGVFARRVFSSRDLAVFVPISRDLKCLSTISTSTRAAISANA